MATLWRTLDWSPLRMSIRSRVGTHKRRAMPIMLVRRWSKRRTGATLLEVLVAIVILATAGMALAARAAQTTNAFAAARGTETELRRASAFFDAIALWPRDDLDRHLGDRAEGPWRLTI